VSRIRAASTGMTLALPLAVALWAVILFLVF
jgi:hypothetical protein